MNQDFNQQQYNDKLAQVASLAITYAKDGTGYHSMKDAFNELCEISHADKGIDQEKTIGRRTLLVQSVCIKAIGNTKTCFKSRKPHTENKNIPRTKLTAATNTHPHKVIDIQDNG